MGFPNPFFTFLISLSTYIGRKSKQIEATLERTALWGSLLGLLRLMQKEKSCPQISMGTTGLCFHFNKMKICRREKKNQQKSNT
jgi:hypothetical protein